MSNIQNDKETDDIKPLADNKYKDSIVKFMEECDTPFSLALSGKWGSGKTSMMKAIQKEVSTDKNTTIWFNPWENEQHPEPIVPLLQAIMKEISTIHKIKEQSLKMADVIIKSALDTFKSIIDITTAQQHGEKYEYDNFQYIHRQDKLNTMFEQAVKMVLCVKDEIKIDTVLKPNDNSKLIIFIDDLDRCEDSTIIKLLSSIKHHLFTEHCIFIFGYDRFHIEKSISKAQIRH